jgi:hypothetical protein
VIENDTPQSLEDLEPFEASVQQAIGEMNALLIAARVSNRMTSHHTTPTSNAVSSV